MTIAANSAAAADITITDARAFPESVTVTASGAVIASSYALGTIYRAAPGAATAQPWILTAASGLTSSSGVLADDANHRLLACGVGSGGMAVMEAFNLDTGAIQATYPFPAGGHCNDMTIGPGGAVFVTDTTKGRVLGLDGTTLTTWAAGPKLDGADGITLSPAGGALIVSSLMDKLVSIAIRPDGSAGVIDDLTTSQPLHSPDGLHPGPGHTLLLADAGGGKVDEVTVSAGHATLTLFKGGFMNPTAAVLGAGNAYVVDPKLPLRVASNLTQNAGPFTITVVPVPSR